MKNAIVIGATSGMGRELARILVGEGYTVGITGRRLELLKELKSENPGHYLISHFDCRDLQNTNYLESLSASLEPVELIILSAGNGEINKELDFNIEHETNELNVLAFTEIVGWAFRYFKKKGSGQLAVITSIAGIRGGRVAPAYNASKAYQIKYLEGLRQRASRLKLPISITDIRPGFVDTDMAKGGGKFWVVPKQKAANQIFKHIKKRKDKAYVSKRWVLIAWLLTLLPQWIYKKM